MLPAETVWLFEPNLSAEARDCTFEPNFFLTVQCYYGQLHVVNNICPPAGLLLRLFSYLYSMDVVEEEALLKWREDLSQEYPGKGKALFQVSLCSTLYTLHCMVQWFWAYIYL